MSSVSSVLMFFAVHQCISPKREGTHSYFGTIVHVSSIVQRLPAIVSAGLLLLYIGSTSKNIKYAADVFLAVRSFDLRFH